MFTKKQIEEIAAKLAELAIKDSQFNDIVKPLNGSESLPLIQDGENRLMTLPDLVNLIIGEEDRQYIKCILDISCQTENAIIEIKGQGKVDYTQQSTYSAYYGEIVDVRVSAEGYDTWQDVVTMTQDHTVVVALNKSGGEAPGPEQETHWIMITNSQGAKITLNRTEIVESSKYYFSADSTVDVVVSLEGYQSFVDTYLMDRNRTIPVSLQKKSSKPDDPYLYFKEDTATIRSDGDRVTVDLLSNIDWVITASEPYKEDEEGGDTPSPEPSPSPDETPVDTDLPREITVYQGETQDIY